MNILVTGANGFVGRVLCEQLLTEGHRVSGTVWEGDTPDASRAADGIRVFRVNSILTAPWPEILRDIDAVVHLAGRVHVMGEEHHDHYPKYYESNVLGTRTLAAACVTAGIKRLVFASTIKINGENNGTCKLDETSAVSPSGPYAQSKWEAEQNLREIEASDGLGVTILRIPLVYGPGVRANFFKLLRLIDKGMPLPFGGIDNRRSMIYVGNLADAIAECLGNEDAKGHTFLVADVRIYRHLSLLS